MPHYQDHPSPSWGDPDYGEWIDYDEEIPPPVYDLDPYWSIQQTGELGPGFEKVISGPAVRLRANALPDGVDSMNTTIRVTGKTTGATWLIGIVIKNGELVPFNPPLTPLPEY